MWQDASNLKDQWVSVVNDVANKHSLSDIRNFHKCAPGTHSSRGKKEYSGSNQAHQTHIALEDVVTNPRLLKYLGKLTDF